MRSRYLLVGFLFLVLLGGVLLLGMTRTGLVLVQRTINHWLAERVSIGRVDGRLFDHWQAEDLRLAVGPARVRVAKLDYGWRPSALLGGQLAIDRLVATGVAIELTETAEDASRKKPAEVPLRLPVSLLPFGVSIGELAVNRLSLVDGRGQELFVLDRLSGALDGDRHRLAIGRLAVQGPEFELGLHGSLEAGENWVVNLLGTWTLAGFGFHPLAGSFSATGPLMGPHVELGLHSPGYIRVAGDFRNLLDQPEWTATLTAKAVDLSAHIEDCPQIVLAAVRGRLSGDLSSYRGHVEAEGRWDTLTDLQLKSDLIGDGWGIDFRTLRIDGPDSFATADGGSISWRDIFSWQGRFHFVNFDPSFITEELQGLLSARFASKGDVTEHGVIASFDIARLHGLLHDHQIAVRGKVFLDETSVHTDGLTVQSGEVTGVAHLEQALYSWADQPHWSYSVKLDRFDPSFLFKEFPGSIDGHLAGEGSWTDQGLAGRLRIDELGGTLRGQPIAGGGTLTLAAGLLKTDGLKLTSGRSELVVEGKAGEGLALDLQFDSPDLGQLLPEAGGSLKASARIEGSLKAPQAALKVEGKGLRFKEVRLAGFKAGLHGQLAADGPWEASLSATGLAGAGVALDRGSVSLKGSLADHRVEAAGQGRIGSFAGSLHGGYRHGWRGQLEGLRLAAPKYGSWQQRAATDLELESSGLRLGKLCLSDGASLACLAGDARLDQPVAWRVEGELSALPLQWLNGLQLVEMPLSGEMRLALTAAGDDQGVQNGRLEARLTKAKIQLTGQDREPVAFQFDAADLLATLSGGGLRVNSRVEMAGGSRATLEAEVDNAGSFTAPLNALPLRGRLAFEAFDLALLGAFTGYGVDPSGKVTDSLALAGSVGRPQVSGKLRLQGGGIALPYQGITLENIVLAIDTGPEFARVTGTATSGPGSIDARGTLGYGAEGIEGSFQIDGQNFLLVNLPEYALRVNPAVRLTFNRQGGALQGTIDLPYGQITPEEMSNSIKSSEDVVFVTEGEEEEQAGWPFKLDLQVRLGDEVQVDGYGLTGRVGGQLQLTTNPDYSLAGRGELELIDGSYSIYGRVLTIARGRILFTGGPIDNPGIDVRAQIVVPAEEVKGRGYTVGMDISGLVQDLQYHLFSDPYMDDTEILSLLIVGHSLAGSTEEEGNVLAAAAVTLGLKGGSKFVKGLGSYLFLDDVHFEGSSTKEDVSLVFGKRVTKDLYLGYDLNMYNRLGQFRVRYDLTRGFSVETYSSSEATGADLLYSFER